MTYIVYGDLKSGAFSSEAALAEGGADYRFERVSLEKNEQKKAEFLAINPSGKMPALRLPDGTIVTFTSVDSKGRSTVDARIKKGVARAQLPSTQNATLSVASGVVVGNEIHWGGGM